MKIIFISGSLASNSKSFLLLKKTVEIAKERGIETEFIDLKELNMLFCDGRAFDLYPKEFHAIFDQIQKADFIVFGMPIYCYSVSGPLKNFIDIFSGAFKNKRFGICASAGSRRSYLATADLIKILGYECNATGVQPLVLTDHHDFENGRIVDEKIPARIERMLDSLTNN